MEDTQTPATTDDGAVDPSPPSEPAAPAPAELASFDDIFRDQARADVKDADADPDDDADGPDDAESAPKPGDVKAEQQQGKQGRRARAAEENAQRIADLERQVAERDPEKIREEVLQQARDQFAAEQQRQAEDDAVKAAADADAEKAAWYLRVRDVPDRNLSDEDYRKREEYKAQLDAFPEATRTARAVAQQEAQAEKDAHKAEVTNFWQGIHGRFGLLQTLEGVTKEALSDTDLYAIGEHLYATGARVREDKVRAELQPKLDKALDEVRRLKAEASQFRLNGRGGLAAARAPMTGGGRSGPSGPGRPDMKTSSASDLFDFALRQESDRRGLSSDE